jgi:phage terminase small subunit
MPKKANLTEKQERFCREYLIDLNGSAAAIRAGYSQNGASVQATRLLGIAKVKAKITELLAESKKRVDLRLDDVLRELKKIVFARMDDIASWSRNSVSLVPSARLDPEVLSVIESLSESTNKDGTPQLRVKLHSKLRACELILKFHELTELESRILALEEKVAKR